MARNYRVFDELLDFVSTSRSRSTVTLAAVSFAICHLAAMATGSAVGVASDSDLEIPRQLIHFAAEFCRFVLPFGFMVAGFATRAKS